MDGIPDDSVSQSTKSAINRGYTPTPEEIKRVCAEIREGWNQLRWEREVPYSNWVIPTIKDPTMSSKKSGRRPE
jgi:hypothetical protein